MFFSISTTPGIKKFLDPLSDSSDILFRNVLDASYDSILITEADLDAPKIVYVNPAFCRMTGYEASEVIGKSPKILQGKLTDTKVTSKLREALEAGESYEAHAVNYRKDGSLFHLQWRTSPVMDEDGSVSHYMAVQRDITDEVRLMGRLKRKAELDSLTNLLSRGAGNEDLEDMLERADEEGEDVTLIMLDIDHFKSINDSAGHATGDHVIRSVAKIIDGRTRGNDLAIRWGGEEFMCVLWATPLNGARLVGESIRKAVSRESIENIDLVTISGGVVQYETGETVSNLAERVDEKLYEAKSSGRNQIVS